MIEKKVQASTAAAAVAGLALWALGRYVFKGAVPDVVASWVYVLVPAAITFGAGYLAKHTPRPVPQVAIVAGTSTPSVILPHGVPEAPAPPAGPVA